VLELIEKRQGLIFGRWPGAHRGLFLGTG
jgi:hypothetical protein